MNIIDYFGENKQVKQWLENSQNPGRQMLIGLSDSVKSIAIANLFKESHSKIVVVTDTQFEAEKIMSDLSALIGSDSLYNFFTDDMIASEFLYASNEKTRARLETIHFLLDKKAKGVLVSSISAFKLLLTPPHHFKKSIKELSVGQENSLKEFVNLLSSVGYTKVDKVDKVGEYSQRGDIVDIYESSSHQPIRIEFFGDEIDGIRKFDVDSQKTIETLDSIKVFPNQEILFLKEDIIILQKEIDHLISINSGDNQLVAFLQEMKDNLQENPIHPELKMFLSMLYDREYTLLDYIDDDTYFIIDDINKIADKQAKLELDSSNFLTQRLHEKRAVAKQKYTSEIAYDKLRKRLFTTYISKFKKGVGHLKLEHLYHFNQHSVQEFFGQLPHIAEEINHYRHKDYTVIIQFSSLNKLTTFKESLREYGIEAAHKEWEKLEETSVNLIEGNISKGFVFPENKLIFMTEFDLFHKKVKRKWHRKQVSNAEKIKSYNELKAGDYVVHSIHGIGKYIGIETMTIDGIHRDYLTIQYQNHDQISLPVNQIDLLTKYVASDGKSPRLNKLNDGRFKKIKQKVEKDVEEVADELLSLYAERSQLKGHTFSRDDDLQREFDTNFPYVETEDQLRSIKEVKKDMEKNQPMDRLLVGDVGFGKTEVAMRAAFKAVNDGKQVAVLVPTTVLAQQHYLNFYDRFENFPITLDVLSRFKTKIEQKEIITKVKKGEIDILIGTHRLLSDDVQFHDLGLMIIDEEQRFGVKHKEKLKLLKKHVDVLTLTATPIPRTLQMSMLGIRDLSVIETPPTNRYPVQTYILENEDGIIRDAVLREMSRDGQVFYVYNKVDTIEQKVYQLNELIPEASIGFIHGRMSELEIENTLLSFIDGEYDILVTTTIIETGIDMPNVNTLFIENADHMGLSTLYQLRGRVGRSNKVAYAYLMYRQDKILSELSEKRLDAIKGFTDLGSGFKIAMRDLSIRGAGNLLGTSQSGFIDSVGFEMYSQLLKQAIAKKQGKTYVPEKGNTEIDWPLDAYIPETYISDEKQKIEIYRLVKKIDTVSDYEDFQDELIDRFGDYPQPVEYLLKISLLKSLSDKLFVKLLKKKGRKLTILFDEKSRRFFLMQDLFKALSKTNLKSKISETSSHDIELLLDARGQNDDILLSEIMKVELALIDLKK